MCTRPQQVIQKLITKRMSDKHEHEKKRKEETITLVFCKCFINTPIRSGTCLFNTEIFATSINNICFDILISIHKLQILQNNWHTHIISKDHHLFEQKWHPHYLKIWLNISGIGFHVIFHLMHSLKWTTSTFRHKATLRKSIQRAVSK